MSVETSAAFSLLLTIISLTMGQECPQPCACPAQPPACPVGSSLVLDGCGCCKLCARQQGEACSLLQPCDHHKQLYCHTDTGICTAQEGEGCELGGLTYRSGESFQPSCKHRCVCMNGEIGCVPLCSRDMPIPSPDCPYPRRITIPGRCCEEWVCEQTPHEDQHFQSVMAGASHTRPLPSSRVSSQGALAESPTGNCIVQTTEWSECSATCGMAVSSRVTNDNQRCQLERQTRICMVRPCNSQQDKDIKKGKKCVRTPKVQQEMRFELSGCSSTRLYKPKFCGVCTDNRCCTPQRTVTAEVQFLCPEGDFFTKKMMFIKACSCHLDCPQDNDIFLASNTRRMTGDYENDI